MPRLFDFDAARRRFVMPDTLEEEIAAARTASEDPATPCALARYRPHLAVFDRSGRGGLRAGLVFRRSQHGRLLVPEARSPWCRFPVPSARCRSTPFTPSCAWLSLTCSAWPSPSPMATSPPTIRASSRGWLRSSTSCNRFPCSAFCRPLCWPWFRSFPAISWASRWASSCSSSPGRCGILPSAFTPRSRPFPGRWWRPRASIATPAGSDSGSLKCPYAAIGLVWNSIVSVAGGWFALIFCETFTMGDRNFQLPGLGSYIQTATYEGDVHALLAGIATVILIVVATDQLVWRPLIAWSDKFKFEQVESAEQRHFADPRTPAPVQDCCETSPAASGIAWRSRSTGAWRKPRSAAWCGRWTTHKPRKVSPALWALALAAALAVCWAAAQAMLMLRTITWPDLRLLLEGAAATFLRVNAALAALRSVDDSCRRRHRPQSASSRASCSRWRR